MKEEKRLGMKPMLDICCISGSTTLVCILRLFDVFIIYYLMDSIYKARNYRQYSYGIARFVAGTQNESKRDFNWTSLRIYSF